jgi:CheY-like chemotaxis protein
VDRQRERYRLLLVEDDEEIRAVVSVILADEGYTSEACSGPATAQQRVEEYAFNLIIADLFPSGSGDLLQSVTELRVSAYPTPVMVMTAHRIDLSMVQQRGFCAVLAKPFDLDELLLTVSACLDVPLDAQQLQQAHVVDRYFDALSRRDWDAFVDLCASDVIYSLPGASAFAQTIVGKEALRAFTEQTFGAFPDARFERVRTYATPHGLAARYQGSWQGPAGHELRQSGAVLFGFTGLQITHIGVRLHAERLETLTRFRQVFGADAPGGAPP